jgi:hypothetical protein
LEKPPAVHPDVSGRFVDRRPDQRIDGSVSQHRRRGYELPVADRPGSKRQGVVLPIS